MESILSQETQDPINLYFVLITNKTESTCSEKLASAFQACLDVGFRSSWIKEKDVLLMQPGKQDVFICDPFEGAAFEHVSSGKFKCVVLGPPCLQACLSRSEPVPELPYPLYTAAMRGMVVTTTGFPKPEKLRLQRRLRQMSAVFSSDFHEGVTHLVAGVVASLKYQVAVSRDVPVMRAGWVDRVWEISCQQHVQGTDAQFADLTCPPFQGLFICVSQLSRKDKDAIRKIIETNGGSYMAQLECEKTNVLVSPCMEGEKVSFARRWQIPCVVPEWLYDSVERGSCLPMEDYSTTAKAKLSSTPTKNHTTAAHAELADLTMSTIQGANESRVMPVEETLMNETAAPGPERSALPQPTADQEDLAELDRLDVQQTVRTGQFLDGCKIHLVGFDARRDEKLRRLLNAAGAMRFSQLLPSVTHVVVGGGAPPAAAWQPQLVTLRWLLDSCRAGRPLPETEYPAPGAPPPPPPPDTEPETAPPLAEEPSVVADDTTLASVHSLFGGALLDGAEDSPPRKRSARGSWRRKQGLSFFLSDQLEAAAADETRRLLQEHGGHLAETAEHAYFTVVPLGYTPRPGDDPDRLVTPAYPQHCVELDKVVEPEYYHRPIGPARPEVLVGCVLGISSYSGRERHFLALLAESLGAEFQEVFARRDNPSKGARASTHLVCQAAEGHKFAAARKWGLPAVSRQWLLACAAAGRQLGTEPFTVDAGADNTVVSGPLAAASTSAASVASVSSTGAAVPAAATPAAPAPAATPAAPSVAASSATPAAPAAVAPSATPATPQGGGRPVPWYMVPPSSLTPVQTPRRFAAESAERAATALAQQDTPQTPYGSVVAGPDPTASTRKFWKRWLDTMEETPENKRRRISTPLPELAVRFFKNLPRPDPMFTGELDTAASSTPTPGLSAKAVNEELQSAAAAAVRASPAARGSVEPAAAARGSVEPAAATRGPAEPAVPSPAAQPVPSADLTAPCADGSGDVTPASDVSRQLAELNQLVTRRSGGVSGVTERRRIPSLETPAQPPESESAPHGGEVSQSQGGAVTWDDPQERLARNNLMSEEAGGQDSENVPPHGSPQKPTVKPPRVVFSGMEAAERTRYQAVVERLGGAALDSASLEPDCTHVVTTRPNRSEKHLAAVASGRWLLQPAYLDACDTAGHFLPEEPYEWGNLNCLKAAGLSKSSTEYKLSTAAYRWRRKIADQGIPGAFHAVVAVLLTSGDRTRAFQRLLTAGGGRAVDPSQLAEATLVIAEPARADPRQLTPALWRRIIERRLPCVQPVYLNECLTAETPPRAEDWLVDEYKRQLAAA